MANRMIKYEPQRLMEDEVRLLERLFSAQDENGKTYGFVGGEKANSCAYLLHGNHSLRVVDPELRLAESETLYMKITSIFQKGEEVDRITIAVRGAEIIEAWRGHISFKPSHVDDRAGTVTEIETPQAPVESMHKQLAVSFLSSALRLLAIDQHLDIPQRGILERVQRRGKSNGEDSERSL